MRRIGSGGVRLAVACCSLLTWTGALPGILNVTRAAPAAATTTPPALDPKTAATRDLALRGFRAAEEEAHRPGADPSDVGFETGKLGFDADRIFTFVRDNTRLEPYPGMLRGALGVLAGGAGNSLDRALLLQAMLTDAGVPCRLIQGTLPEAAARRALQQFLDAPKPAEPAIDPDRSTSAIMARIGAPQSVVADIKARTEEHSAGFWRAVSSQTADRSTYLLGLLTHAGTKPATIATVHQALLRALTTHYWVQRQDKDGHWVDLDPTFADLRPGQTAGQGGRPITAVPPDQRQQLDLSLVYRTKGKEEVVLKQTVDSANALFAPMAFAVQSADANLPSPLGLDARGKVGLIKKMKKFQGVLRVGNVMNAGRPFDLEGNTYDVEPGGVLGNASGVSGAVNRGFGGLGGGLGGGGGDARKENTFVDLRLVLTLRVPGRPARTQFRVLATAARPEPPLINCEVFLQPQFIPMPLASHQYLDYLARQRSFVEGMLSPGKGSGGAPDNWPFPVNAMSFALMRNGALQRTLDGVGGVTPLLDHANLYLTTHRVVVNADSTAPSARWGFDLVDVGINFVPKTADDETKAFEAAVKQGVAESTAEETFLAQSFPGLNVSSAASRFDLARVQGADGRVIKPDNSAAVKALGWAADDAASLSAQEPSDHLVVAAPAATGIAPAWWSVSPGGTVVARGPGGFGEAETDYMELTLNIACKILCFMEMREATTEGTTYAFTSFLICAAMQGVGGGVEMAAEETSWEGIGMIISFVDLALWAGRGMAKPSE